MKQRTGVVASARWYWQPDDAGRPHRRQRIRVEYPDGTETRLVAGESRPGNEVRTGDNVTVLLRPGRPATIVPNLMSRRARRVHRVRGALIACVGLITLVLLIGGGVWGHAISGPDRHQPRNPPASPGIEPASVTPSVSGSTG